MGHLKNPDVPLPGTKRGKEDWVQELQFVNPLVLEGIHVVPNRVSPAGMPFSGRTKPEMQVRPFNLVLFGRVVPDSDQPDTPPIDKLHQLIAVTITGGVQWLPLKAPYNTWKVDYLAIKGDFEELSLIIHGESHSLEGGDTKPLKLLPLPYPAFYEDLLEMTRKMHPGVPAVPALPSQPHKLVQIETTSLSAVLNTPLPKEGKVKRLLPESGSTSADSFIWLSEAAQLVEVIFSHTAHTAPYATYDEMHKDVEFLEKVNALLESCWEVRSFPPSLLCSDCLFVDTP